MVTLTDPSGHAQHFSYDVHGRLISWTADDGTQVSYAYDNLGRRTSMTDATGTTRYAYDAVGNLLTVTEPDGAVFTAQYDQAGQRTSLTYPGGLQVTYRYDPKGKLAGLHDSRAGDAAYAVDADGRLVTEQLPGRLARRYHYEHGLLHRFAVWRDGVPVASTELVYDPDARITSQRDDGQPREYRYDQLGQLISVRHPERDRDALYLTYDAVGNRTSMRHGDRHIHYRYDDASQLVAVEADGRHTEYQYDTSGRLTEQVTGDDHQVITYDGFGRPVKVTATRGPRAQRQTATFNGDGLTTLLVLTSQDDQREEERTASVRYRWSLDPVPEILAQQAEPVLDNSQREHPNEFTADFSYGYGRVWASHERGAEAFHHDVFGSTVRTDRTAAWAQAATYQAFGGPEPDHRPGPQGHRDSERDHELHAPELPRFGYRGELALGPLIDLRARTYDADLGRFLTRDQAGSGDAGNPYSYAANDPFDRSDPLGLMAVPPPGGAVGAVLAVPHTIVPTAGQRADARSTVHLTAAMAAEGDNFSTLHNQAVATAMFAFTQQLAASFTDFYTEVGVPDAGKFGGPTGRGDVDLVYVGPDVAAPLFKRHRLAYLWEVKKDSRGSISRFAGTPQAANEQAAKESANYAAYWNKNPALVGANRHLAPRFADTIASPGPGLLTVAPIPGGIDPLTKRQQYVYSLHPLMPEGAVLYGPLPRSGRQPPRSPMQPPWWWLIALLLGIGKREQTKGSGQPQPAGRRPPVVVPLLPLTPGTVPAGGAVWPFLAPAYTSVYGLEPPR